MRFCLAFKGRSSKPGAGSVVPVDTNKAGRPMRVIEDRLPLNYRLQTRVEFSFERTGESRTWTEAVKAIDLTDSVESIAIERVTVNGEECDRVTVVCQNEQSLAVDIAVGSAAYIMREINGNEVIINAAVDAVTITVVAGQQTTVLVDTPARDKAILRVCRQNSILSSKVANLHLSDDLSNEQKVARILSVLSDDDVVTCISQILHSLERVRVRTQVDLNTTHDLGGTVTEHPIFNS